GGYLPETLLAVCNYDVNNNSCYIGNEQSYSRFYVEVGDDIDFADNAYTGYFDSGKRGSVKLKNKKGNTDSISLTAMDDGLQATASYGKVFYRIVGYR
ncbi:hypothetical protein, partial [Collinsella tanakaei]|uniref:hypothetical protein n=1 Tax=Collinsella tanakaei TaxID=626935 RepID=UPI0022E9598B